MDFRRKIPNSESLYNILNFLALFSALAVEQKGPGGQNGRPSIAEKSAGKFRMFYQVLTLRFFSPEIHALNVLRCDVTRLILARKLKFRSITTQPTFSMENDYDFEFHMIKMIKEKICGFLLILILYL